MRTEMTFDDADLNGFVDGRLEPSRAAAMSESLSSDPDARARIEAWQKQNHSLRTMFASVLFEPVPVRLQPVAIPPRETPVAPRPGGRLAGSLVATCGGVALIGFAFGVLASAGTDDFGLRPSENRASGAAERPSADRSDAGNAATRAAENHRTFLTDPSHAVELAASEEPKVARWLARRLGPGLHVPDLTRQGWPLLGGRIVPGRHGPAAFLTYGSGADHLGLTVSREAAPTEARVVAVDDVASPLGVATWNDGEFNYALTSDRGPEWLGRNLGPLRDSAKAQARAGSGNAPRP